MLDESLLDNPDALARTDTTGSLLGIAAAGARVRCAARLIAEAGLDQLKPDGRPRSVLIAGPGPWASDLADLLGAIAACPVLPLRFSGPALAPETLHWHLPGWAGPFDLLLVTTPEGTEPGMPSLVERAYRHGCPVVAVAPAGTPITEALEQAHGFTAPFASPGYGTSGGHADDPGTFWALLTPVLALADRIGLLSSPPTTVDAIAGHLDSAAERFGPAAEAYGNPAKALAADLEGALPLVWSEGAVTGTAARRFARTLASRAGCPSLAAPLPEALAEHLALLSGSLAPTSGDLHDFFRDRVEERPGPLRLRIVLFREQDAPIPGAVREAADTHQTPLNEIEAPAGAAVESLAELFTLSDFTTLYLSLAARNGTSP